MMTPSSPPPYLSVQELRCLLIAQCPDLAADTWWLLGTSHCHLCEQAQSLIQRLQSVVPLCYQALDITTLDEETMAWFAAAIPVLLTPSSRLDYPFSVLDLQRLC